MRKVIQGIGAIIAALALPVAAHAANPLALTGYVKLEKISIDADGQQKVERVDPKTVVPGDRLIFGTSYANTGTAPVEDFVISNPVPPAVMVAGEIDGAQIVSVDGGKTWGSLASRTVIDPAGERRAATAADITHMRWTIAEVAPGTDGQVEFAVTVR